jgi:hypothetical protein
VDLLCVKDERCFRAKASQNGNVRSDAPAAVTRGDVSLMPYRESLGEYQPPSSLALSRALAFPSARRQGTCVRSQL